MERREVWGASSLDQYLADAEKKYTAESKVADLMTLQQFLRDRIAVETSRLPKDRPAAAPRPKRELLYCNRLWRWNL